MFNIQTVLKQALALAAQYWPPAQIAAPLVMGIATALLHHDPAPRPTHEDGSPWTDEEIAAYRAEVLVGVERVLAEIDDIGAKAAAEKARAIADMEAWAGVGGTPTPEPETP